MAHLPAFVAVAALVIATPGQDTALTIRNTLAGGRRAGIFTAIGVSLGQVTWTLATSLGVGAVLLAYQPAYTALRLAGAAYLIALGAHSLVRAIRVRGAAQADGAEPAPRHRTPPAALRQGLLSNLGNPKMLAFFTSLLPQFASSFGGLLAFGLLFCTMTLLWLVAYSFAVARAGAFLRRTRVRRAFDALTGTVLVALGVRLAREAR